MLRIVKHHHQIHSWQGFTGVGWLRWLWGEGLRGVQGWRCRGDEGCGSWCGGDVDVVRVWLGLGCGDVSVTGFGWVCIVEM